MKRTRTLIRWLMGGTLVVVGYYALTAVAISYCASDLSRPSMGCISLFWDSGTETRFLIRMRTRSIPAIKQQLARTDLKLLTRIHLAWILSCIGDHSCFHTFIDGLASDRSIDQSSAYGRMRDFPDECARYFPEILAVRGQRKSESYWWLIDDAVKRAHLDGPRRDRVDEITFHHISEKSPLSEEEQREILALLKPGA